MWTLRLLRRFQAGPGWGLSRIAPFRLVHRALSGIRLGSWPVRLEANGLALFVSPDDLQLGTELLRNGAYESEEVALFERTLQPGMVVVDAGANVGVYAFVAARSVGPQGQVIAFEPDPESANLLALGVAANGFTNVTLVERALAATSGEAELFRLPGHPGLTSLSRSNARGSAAHVTIARTTLDAELESRRLDRVDVVKLDVQGAELDTLRGARRTLARHRPTLFLEYWPAGLLNYGSDPRELMELLLEHGYSLRSVQAPDAELDLDTLDRLQRASADDFGVDLVARPS